MGRQEMVVEVATGEAHPPRGMFHYQLILVNYPKVVVGTMKPKLMMDHPTPEGMSFV
jgi:hypothetical protein